MNKMQPCQLFRRPYSCNSNTNEARDKKEG